MVADAVGKDMQLSGFERTGICRLQKIKAAWTRRLCLGRLFVQ